METMHAAGRRTLPPVPRSTAEPLPATADESGESDSPTERFVVDLTTGEQRAVVSTDLPDDVDVTADIAGDTAVDVVIDVVVDADEEADGPVDDDLRQEDGGTGPSGGGDPAPEDLDPAQEFVIRLRTAAADFAEAAGAESAVVREAVPPARHRRARCRLVLRYADASEVDLTFLGRAGLPGRPSRHGFDRQIRRWLADGQRRDQAWLVADPDAEDGLAVDLSAWLAAA